MAMRTATPWWLSAIFAAGLFFLFLGERPFAHLDTLRIVLSGLGFVLALGATFVRMLATFKSTGKRRQVERTLLLCHLGVMVALLGYLATTGFGVELLGLDDLDAKGKARFTTATTVLWAILLLVSLVPLLMAEISLGLAQRDRIELGASDDASAATVDSFRVSAMTTSGLTIALAAAFLMVTCNVAKERNIRRDVSYFKTSSPGTATINMVSSISEPIKVLLFFPEVNEVKQEVRDYFEALAGKTGNIEIEEHDKVVSSRLAEQYKVQKEGTIVVVRGEKHEIILVSDDIKKARRNELRTFDSKVQQAAMKVIREKRVAYLTVGHGEVNDPTSLSPLQSKNPNATATLVKKILATLNYQVKDLGAGSGLTTTIPDDATIVIMLAPSTPLQDEELETLDHYLAGGGSALLVLDPMRKATLGVLEGRLGVHFDATRLVDDKRPQRQRGTKQDGVILLAREFSSHASVTTLSRHGNRDGIPMVLAGSLVDAPFTTTGTSKPKRTYVIQSPKSTFADVNENFAFDKDSEKRAQFNLAAAIEDPSAKPDEVAPEGDSKNAGMRAMVFTDAEIFLDVIQGRVPIAQFMFADAIKWLGGEEHFAGTTISEKDKRIKHTRNEDAVWFYGSIVGAPLLVLGFGLGSVSWRRRRQRRKS